MKIPLRVDEARYWEGQKLLVISPHPDDEVFGCAGTMAKAKSYGCQVYVMILSVGDLQFYEKKSWVTIRERKKEVEQVGNILKLDGFDIVYEDTKKHLRLDTLPRRDLVAKIERESSVSLDKVQPTVVAIPAPSYNQDHVAVFEACLTATRIHAGGKKVSPRTVIVYESPTLCWNEEKRKFHPNFYVDISNYLSIRKRCIQAYKTQKRDSKDPCSLANLEDLARVRGREVGRAACEAYQAYRLVY
ncbi:MAG: PIG-L family deacetylase [Candidatus Omnitrophica bacterium]|nr:PIG-L family deacetylase [Candidatus Omnitrophota bacterium]